MTKCIAIDTSTIRLTLAVLNDGEFFELSQENSLDHARDIYSNINKILNDARVELQDLELIGFGLGPGRFSGLRVAAAATQAMSYTHRIPVCGISSLSVMAQHASEIFSIEKIAVAIDANRNQIYFGCYHVSEDGLVVATYPDRLVNVDDFDFSERDYCGIGLGWLQYNHLGDKCCVELINQGEKILPDARIMIKLAIRDFKSGKTVNSFEALPNYLKDQVTN